MSKYIFPVILPLYVGLLYGSLWLGDDAISRFNQQFIFIFLMWFLLFGIGSFVIGSRSVKISAIMALLVVSVFGSSLYLLSAEQRSTMTPYLAFWEDEKSPGKASSPAATVEVKPQSKPSRHRLKSKYPYERILKSYQVIDPRGAPVLYKPETGADEGNIVTLMPSGSTLKVVGKITETHRRWYLVALDNKGKVGYVDGRRLNTPETKALLAKIEIEEEAKREQASTEKRALYQQRLQNFALPNYGCEELPYIPPADASERTIDRAQQRADRWFECSVDGYKKDLDLFRTLVIKKLDGEYFTKEKKIYFRADGFCDCSNELSSIMDSIKDRNIKRIRQREKFSKAISYFNAEIEALELEQDEWGELRQKLMRDMDRW